MKQVKIWTSVAQTPIDIEFMRKSAWMPTSGATVIFCGDVRNHDHERSVLSLDYEAHPSANAVLKQIAREIVADHKIESLYIAHRYGKLAIGDTALGVVVSAQHSTEAFAACSDAVKRIKELLPLWKHQFFTDGSDEWVNSA